MLKDIPLYLVLEAIVLVCMSSSIRFRYIDLQKVVPVCIELRVFFP